MKIAFIHSTANDDIRLTSDAIAKLPKKIGIISNIQHLHKVQDIKKQLPNSIICGQVLGCRADNAVRCAKNVDAFLFVGGGVFHPLFAAVKTGKTVFCWNPADKLLTKIRQEDIDAFKKNHERQLKIFYSADNVGLLISAKTSQSMNKINKLSISLKMKIPVEFSKRKDKNYFLFAFDTLDLSELENFPFIDCLINTACSRIADEKSNIVNLTDILEFEAENA